MHVLLAGATGVVGGRLGPALVEADHRVTALVTDADRYDAPTGIRVVEGGLLDPGSFEAAVLALAAIYDLGTPPPSALSRSPASAARSRCTSAIRSARSEAPNRTAACCSASTRRWRPSTSRC